MGVVRAGDPVPLTYQSPFRETALFVRAIVTKPDGSPVTGSPFTLPHVTAGSYRAVSYPLMGSDAWWLARYEPFLDAGFTAASQAEGSTEEVFHQGVPIEPSPFPGNAAGVVSGDSASGSVQPDEVTAEASGSTVSGSLEKTDDAAGAASDDDATGQVEC